MKSKLPIIIVVVLLIVVGAGLYFFVFRNSDAAPKVVETLYPMGDAFVTNVKDDTHLLKATVVLELNTDKLTEIMDEKNAVLRDVAIRVLRSFDTAALQKDDALDKVKEAIMAAVNEWLGSDNVVDVLFNDFVMQ